MEDGIGRDVEAIAAFGFGRLFWLTHEAVVGANIQTERVVLWNQSAERIFGYSQEEAIGMPLDRLVPAALADAHHQGIARYRDTAVSRLIGGPPVEVPAVRKNGQALTVSLTLTAVDADERRFIAAVIRDVTAQRAAEEDRAAMVETMRTFLAAASHDLRTPLATVMGYAQLLAERAADLSAEQTAEYGEAITRSGRQASRLVDDLLTISKIEAGVVEVRPEELLLDSAAREALASCGVSAEVEISPDVRVWADKDHVTRILVNLLSNAEIHGKPPIRLSATCADGITTIHVCDGGEGIAREYRPALFEPYTRAKSAGRSGTGLGLSIVQGLTEANGGSVRYDCEEGGSCFVVTLPSQQP